MEAGQIGTGESSKERSPRRRVWIAGALVVAIAALVVVLSQLGGGGGAAPLNAVAAAAVKTQEQPGGRANMRAIITADGKTVTITGQAVFDSENRARATLFKGSSRSSPRLDEVVDGPVLYMRSPEFSLPDGLEWMKIDLEDAVGLKVPAQSGTDPRDELSILEVAGNFQKLGKDQVRGEATTHYRGTIGIAEAVERLREKGEDELAENYEENGGPIDFEAWIGSDGIVRRLRLVTTITAGQGKEVNSDMTMTFFDFGLEPSIVVPDSDSVYDATSLAE